jgi:hypothetical protein
LNDFMDAVRISAGADEGSAIVLTPGTDAGVGISGSGLSIFDASSDGVTLAADGLDSITNTDPTGLPDNFREKLLWLYRRFFKKATRTADTITHYADDGTTVLLEQTISDVEGTETQGAATEPE